MSYKRHWQPQTPGQLPTLPFIISHSQSQASVRVVLTGRLSNPSEFP